MQMRQSDMRFKIDQLFREAGIVIAFPQRDVHLGVTGPLDIRLLNDVTDKVIKDSTRKAA